MPIRPSEKSRYPKNWKEISQKIRARSGGQCECLGECGLHTENGHSWRCLEFNGTPAKWANGKIVLTVAHLDHTPENCADDNLKAMCQRCHLRYDSKHHQKNAAKTRAAKNPQLQLEGLNP